MADRVVEGAKWHSAGVEARMGAFIAAASEVGIAISLVSLAGPEPRMVYVSDKGVEIFGRPREAIIGSAPGSLLTGPERVAQQSIGEKVYGERGARSFETMIARGDGRESPVEVSLAPIELDGAPGLVAFTREITERRDVLDALARSERRFRQLVEGAPDAVFINDGRRLVFANLAAARMLRYPDVASLLAIDPRTLFTPEDGVSMRERSAQMVRTGKGLPPRDYPTRRSDGTFVLTEVQSMPIEWDGRPAILGFARDVTERKELEARLAQSDRLAALGTLLAGIAHEMNNPLAYTLLGIEQAIAAIDGAAIPADVAAKLSEALASARHGLTRVTGVIGQIRATSRRDAEGRGLVDLASVVEAALRVAHNEVQHRARLVTELGLAPKVLGSAQRLEQVVLNLIVNAMQALPDGRDGNEIRVTLSTGSAGEAVIEVVDNGHGIPEDVRSRVFDPFFTTKAGGIGLGLGLSICHGIVTAHGGTITVASDEGHGSTFTVVLPAARAEAGVPAPAPETPSRPNATGAPRRRVLVIDDEAALAAMIQRVLGRECDVTVAADAREGLARLTGVDAFDVILCDLMMPDMTGMDLYAEAARRHAGLERRFVFMTGGAFTPRAAEFLERVPNRRLEKPFETSALREIVAKA
ncbi:MAG TPA: ATP-binding protein [Polyangia bacterium]|nr:ATP-binding protein [Polyangia bacterium]